MRSITVNELNQLSKVKESKSEALHPYSTGVARKPVDRTFRRNRSLKGTGNIAVFTSMRYGEGSASRRGKPLHPVPLQQQKLRQQQ
jgi:hypothetical protein